MSNLDELEKLQKLKEQGILTDEEFQKEKNNLLNASGDINSKTNISNNKIKSKFSYNKYLIISLIIIVIIVLSIGLSGKIGKVEVPNVIGLSKEEANAIMEKQGLTLLIDTEEYSSSVEDGHIISQTPRTNSKIKKGSKIIAVVSKGDEPEDVKQERLKQEELQNRIPNAIKEYAEIVRAENSGTVKYNSYTKYKTAPNGKVVYKIKYSTSSSNNTYSRIYYYQLVSLDDENKEVVKSTKLYLFHETTIGNEREEYGDDYAMEYEYERLWGGAI